jgi:hypothetical protein
MPLNHDYEYPDLTRQSHQYEYPSVVTPQTKTGESDVSTGNTAVEGDYAPLVRPPLSNDKEEGDYTHLTNVGKGKEEKNAGNEANGLVYVDVINEERTPDVTVPKKDGNKQVPTLSSNGKTTDGKADITGSENEQDRLLYVDVLDNA